MFILSKQYSDKFNELHNKSMNDNQIDNDKYNELVKGYEEYKKNKKKIECFLKLKLLVFSYNSTFSNNNISIKIYH